MWSRRTKYGISWTHFKIQGVAHTMVYRILGTLSTRMCGVKINTAPIITAKSNRFCFILLLLSDFSARGRFAFGGKVNFAIFQQINGLKRIDPFYPSGRSILRAKPSGRVRWPSRPPSSKSCDQSYSHSHLSVKRFKCPSRSAVCGLGHAARTQKITALLCSYFFTSW